MDKELEETVLQRRNTNNQKAHEKMFNIIIHQGNANQKQWDTTLYPLGCLESKSDRKYQQGCGEMRALVHFWWKSKMV